MSGEEDVEPIPTEFKVIETDKQRRQNELRRALFSRRDNYRMFISGLLIGITGNVFVSSTFEVIKIWMEGIIVTPNYFNTMKLLFGLSFIAIVLELYSYYSWMQDINTQIRIYLQPLPGTEPQSQ